MSDDAYENDFDFDEEEDAMVEFGVDADGNELNGGGGADADEDDENAADSDDERVEDYGDEVIDDEVMEEPEAGKEDPPLLKKLIKQNREAGEALARKVYEEMPGAVGETRPPKKKASRDKDATVPDSADAPDPQAELAALTKIHHAKTPAPMSMSMKDAVPDAAAAETKDSAPAPAPAPTKKPGSREPSPDKEARRKEKEEKRKRKEEKRRRKEEKKAKKAKTAAAAAAAAEAVATSAPADEPRLGWDHANDWFTTYKAPKAKEKVAYGLERRPAPAVPSGVSIPRKLIYSCEEAGEGTLLLRRPDTRAIVAYASESYNVYGEKTAFKPWDWNSSREHKYGLVDLMRDNAILLQRVRVLPKCDPDSKEEKVALQEARSKDRDLQQDVYMTLAAFNVNDDTDEEVKLSSLKAKGQLHVVLTKLEMIPSARELMRRIGDKVAAMKVMQGILDGKTKSAKDQTNAKDFLAHVRVLDPYMFPTGPPQIKAGHYLNKLMDEHQPRLTLSPDDHAKRRATKEHKAAQAKAAQEKKKAQEAKTKTKKVDDPEVKAFVDKHIAPATTEEAKARAALNKQVLQKRKDAKAKPKPKPAPSPTIFEPMDSGPKQILVSQDSLPATKKEVKQRREAEKKKKKEEEAKSKAKAKAKSNGRSKSGADFMDLDAADSDEEDLELEAAAASLSSRENRWSCAGVLNQRALERFGPSIKYLERLMRGHVKDQKHIVRCLSATTRQADPDEEAVVGDRGPTMEILDAALDRTGVANLAIGLFSDPSTRKRYDRIVMWENVMELADAMFTLGVMAGDDKKTAACLWNHVHGIKAKTLAGCREAWEEEDDDDDDDEAEAFLSGPPSRMQSTVARLEKKARAAEEERRQRRHSKKHKKTHKKHKKKHKKHKKKKKHHRRRRDDSESDSDSDSSSDSSHSSSSESESESECDSASSPSYSEEDSDDEDLRRPAIKRKKERASHTPSHTKKRKLRRISDEDDDSALDAEELAEEEAGNFTEFFGRENLTIQA